MRTWPRRRAKSCTFPIVAGGVAIIYNLPGDPKLKLDGDTLADIYLGNITKWNDPKIAALNPGCEPARHWRSSRCIAPTAAARRFIFTDYLSSVSPAWADSVGKGTSVKWPAGIGLAAKGSEGVAGQVKQVPGAIGYAELAYADQNKIPYADMKNAAGNFISPAPDSVSAALATAKIPDDFRFSMVNAPGDEGLSDCRRELGAGLSATRRTPTTAQKLVAFLKWAVTDGQKLSSSLDYAPLPENVQQRELKLLDTIK